MLDYLLHITVDTERERYLLREIVLGLEASYRSYGDDIAFWECWAASSAVKLVEYYSTHKRTQPTQALRGFARL